MSFGKLPIVMYTGYAVLLPKSVSCVLSDAMMIGITVAPGRMASRVACGTSDELCNADCTNVSAADLSVPPPFPRVHVKVDAHRMVWIGVVAFRCEDEYR